MSGRQPISVRRQAALTHAGWAADSKRRAALYSIRERILRGSDQHWCSSEIVQERDKWASYELLQRLNRTMGFEPLSNTVALRLEEEAKAYFHDDMLDRKVCLVTDTWVFPASAIRLSIDDLPYKAMAATLKPGSWCSDYVAQYYDCSLIDQRLKGLMLSRRSFIRNDEGKLCAWMAASVYQELHALERQINKNPGAALDRKPPRFAIADIFVAGAFPEIEESTHIERQVVGLTQIRGVVKVIYAGPGNVLSSHLLCWDNRDAIIASQVPCVLHREHFQLILAGPITADQEILVAKRHECSGERIRRLLTLLGRINPLYADVPVNESFRMDTDISALLTRLDNTSEVNNLVNDARARQSSVAQARGENVNDNDRERTIIECQTAFMETTTRGDEQDRLTSAVASVIGSAASTYVERRSTSLLKSTDPYYMERMFLHLLTFGIGGFSATRCHHYSARVIVLHYLNLSTNQFAEDPLYKLVMFDYLSSRRVKTGVFLRVGQDPTLATTAMRVRLLNLKPPCAIELSSAKPGNKDGLSHHCPIRLQQLAY